MGTEKAKGLSRGYKRQDKQIKIPVPIIDFLKLFQLCSIIICLIVFFSHANLKNFHSQPISSHKAQIWNNHKCQLSHNSCVNVLQLGNLYFDTAKRTNHIKISLSKRCFCPVVPKSRLNK